jgi:hypothetical protein
VRHVRVIGFYLKRSLELRTVSLSVSTIWLPPSSYWRLCNFDCCAACPTNSEAKI